MFFFFLTLWGSDLLKAHVNIHVAAETTFTNVGSNFNYV